MKGAVVLNDATIGAVKMHLAAKQPSLSSPLYQIYHNVYTVKFAVHLTTGINY